MIILKLRKCVVAIGLGLVFGIGSVFGCTCVDMNEPLNDKIHGAYNQASVVFTGKVVALEFQKGISYPEQEEYLRSQGKPSDIETQFVKFEVTNWWKTELPLIFYLVTSVVRSSGSTGSLSSCNYGFEPGKSYLVYATGKGRETRNNACSRTAPLNQAQDDLKLIGPGTKPRDGNK